MTYLIIREKTYSNNNKFYSVHDQTDDKDMALDKVRGYTLANSEEKVRYISLNLESPLVLTREMIVKDNRQLELPFPEVA